MLRAKVFNGKLKPLQAFETVIFNDKIIQLDSKFIVLASNCNEFACPSFSKIGVFCRLVNNKVVSLILMIY